MSNAASNSSTAILVPLSSGRSRHYFYLSAVAKFLFVPDSASYDLAVNGDRDAAWFDGVSSQEFRHRLIEERLVEAIHSNHARPVANSSASKELRGANVTPWR